MAYRAVKSRVNAFGALSEDPVPQKTKAPANPAPKPFVPIVKTNSNWADSSDEEDNEILPTFQAPLQNDIEPQEEEETEEEETEEDEEEEQVDVVVKAKEKKEPIIQLSKKDQKRKEMEDLDSILAELAVEQPVASQPKTTQEDEKKKTNDDKKAAEIEISNAELSSLGIVTDEASGKKKRKKKRKKKSKEKESTASTPEDKAVETVAVNDNDGNAPPVPPAAKLSKADVKAKLLAKKKGKTKKKAGSSASAAAKKEAARRKAGKKKKKDKTKFNQAPRR